MDCSPPGSSVHGISQARILERIAIPFSRGSSQPRNQTQVSYISYTAIFILYHYVTEKDTYTSVYIYILSWKLGFKIYVYI